MSFDIIKFLEKTVNTPFGTGYNLSDKKIQMLKMAINMGHNLTIQAIQTGELPLKALARPIEELKGNEGYILTFKECSAAIYTANAVKLVYDNGNCSRTHFLPLGDKS